MRILEKFMLPLLVGVILIVVTVVIDRKVLSDENRVRELEYRLMAVNGIIDTPYLGTRELEISLDGNPIQNMSTLRVDLYNRTGKDYENVIVYIELDPSTGNAVELITASYQSPIDLPPESVHEVSDTSSPSVPGGKRIGYEFGVLNRSPDPYTPVFEASFLVLGSSAPEASIQVQKTGLMAKEYAYPKASWWLRLVIWVVVATLYLVLFVSMWRMERKQKKLRQQFQDKLRQALTERFNDETVATRAFEVYQSVLAATKTEPPLKRAYEWVKKRILGD